MTPDTAARNLQIRNELRVAYNNAAAFRFREHLPRTPEQREEDRAALAYWQKEVQRLEGLFCA